MKIAGVKMILLGVGVLLVSSLVFAEARSVQGHPTGLPEELYDIVYNLHAALVGQPLSKLGLQKGHSNVFADALSKKAMEAKVLSYYNAIEEAYFRALDSNMDIKTQSKILRFIKQLTEAISFFKTIVETTAEPVLSSNNHAVWHHSYP